MMTENQSISLKQSQPPAGKGKYFENIWKFLLFSIALLTPIFYFVGTKYFSTLAKSFGLASPPKSLSVQEVVVAGVDALLIGPTVNILLLVLVIPTFLLAAWFSVEIFQDKVNDLRSRAPQQILINNKATPSSLSEEQASVLLRNLLDKIYIWTIIGWIFIWSLTVLFIYATIQVSNHAAENAVMQIKTDALSECKECYLYVTDKKEIAAIPIFQGDNQIVVFDGKSTIFLDTSKLTRVQPFKSKDVRYSPRNSSNTTSISSIN